MELFEIFQNFMGGFPRFIQKIIIGIPGLIAGYLAYYLANRSANFPRERTEIGTTITKVAKNNFLVVSLVSVGIAVFGVLCVALIFATY